MALTALTYPKQEQVDILTEAAATEDQWGQSVPGAATEVTVSALVAPGDTEEHLARQSTTTADLTLYAPVGTQVSSSSQVRVRGDVFAVDGQPAVWAGAGVVIRCTRTTQGA